LVSDYLPFLTVTYKEKCSLLLVQELKRMGLIGNDNRIDVAKFLTFVLE